MEFNSQICTTREQSERLLSLGLKPWTADMCYLYGEVLSLNEVEKECDIPAWSFARLLDIFLTDDSYRNILFVYKENHVEYLIRKIEEYAKEGLINKEYMEE